MAIQQSKSYTSESEQEIFKKSRDDESKLIAVMTAVYNPATGGADKVVVTDAKDTRFDANDAAPDYIGINSTSNDADTSGTNWLVYKFTYSGSDVTRIQRATGSWDGRAALF